MGYTLTGDQQKTANRRIGEILRQFGQDEYPYDPERALDALQSFSEGRFESMGARKWREQDGVIYFSVTSDGTTGPQWIERLEAKGFDVRDYAKSVLRSSDFKPTAGVVTEIAVLKGVLFSDDDRVTKNIRAAAYAGTFTQGQKLFDPNAQVTCLIREKFTDEEIEAMGLWWVVAMHEPINDSDGDPSLLSTHRSGAGRALYACCDKPDHGWHRGRGFAFAVSQV